MAVRRHTTTSASGPAPGAEPRVPARVGAFCRSAIEAGDADQLAAEAARFGLTDQAAELVAFLAGGGELRRWPWGQGATYPAHLAAGGLPPHPMTSTEMTR